MKREHFVEPSGQSCGPRRGKEARCRSWVSKRVAGTSLPDVIEVLEDSAAGCKHGKSAPSLGHPFDFP
jgi:hypothetical protein